MPLPANCNHYVLRGTGPGGEIWQTGYWTQSTGSWADEPAFQDHVDFLSSAVNSFFNAIRSRIYSSYALTELRGYFYTGSGVSAEFVGAHAYSPIPGTSEIPGSPIDTCLVATLQTGFAGRSRRGRMYLPFHGTVQVVNGSVTGDVTQYASALKDLFDSINSETDEVPAVVSPTLGDSSPILAVRVDSKPDVQRRRENRLTADTSVTEVLA